MQYAAAFVRAYMHEIQCKMHCQCFTTGEYVEVITDYGGCVEDLQLKSLITGKMRKVLVTHNNDADEVMENTWWKGMLLIPWANRIAYVCWKCHNFTILCYCTEVDCNKKLVQM